MNSKLVLAASVRKKPDTKSEGGSLSSNDKVDGGDGLSMMVDCGSRESPSIRSPRVQFDMDHGEDPTLVSDSVVIKPHRGHNAEGEMVVECESEGVKGGPSDKIIDHRMVMQTVSPRVLREEFLLGIPSWCYQLRSVRSQTLSRRVARCHPMTK